MLSAIAQFKRMVEEFTRWADRYPVDGRTGEWECEYDRWPQINAAFSALLDACAPQQWDDELVGVILYIIARDNETELLKEELESRPDHLIALARAGVHSTERDARWQLADALGNADFGMEEAEPLLECFIADSDEYVRRRALLSFGNRQSPKSEAHAQHAWESGLEYQRMAALDVLDSVNAPVLASYLDLAEQDGREYLTKLASRIRAERSIG